MQIAHFVLLLFVYSYLTLVTGKSKILDKIDGAIESLSISRPLGKGLVQIGKNTILGIPQVVGLELVNVYCKIAAKVDTRIQPEYKPDIAFIKLILKQQKGPDVILKLNDIDMWDKPEFEWSKPLVLFISGWTTTPDSWVNTAMYEAYKANGGFNFMIIDAAKYLDTDYHWAAFNAEFIGEYVADALARLYEWSQHQYILFHCIGHSLGAHICGAAGERFFTLTGIQIPRTTGLDAANPCFYEKNMFRGLDKTDAAFVDVIHTDPGAMGIKQAVGHLDIYANGYLPLQPGCLTVLCSHNRSWVYYAETVYPEQSNNFQAFRSMNYGPEDTGIPIGLKVPIKAEGVYFMKTNSKSPFGPYANSAPSRIGILRLL